MNPTINRTIQEEFFVPKAEKKWYDSNDFIVKGKRYEHQGK